MSQVKLLAADRPMPQYESRTVRTKTVQVGKIRVTMEEKGFSVRAQQYYRTAVDDLELPIRPFRYELDLHATQADASALRAYLERNLRPGERVELWNLWVGEGPARGVYCSGRVENLAVDTLEQLEEQEQTCMTIER